MRAHRVSWRRGEGRTAWPWKSLAFRGNSRCERIVSDSLSLGPSRAVQWPDVYGDAMDTATDALRVEARSFFEDGIAYVCASLWHLTVGAKVEGWVVGADGGEQPPVYPGEASALLASRMVWDKVEIFLYKSRRRIVAPSFA